MPRSFRLLAASLVAVLAMAGAAAARPAPRLASVKVTGIAPTSVSVAWRQPRSGRAGVELFVNGRRIAVVHGRRFTFGTLNCATQYRLTLRARYLGGRRSGRVRLFVTTAPCAAPDPGDQDEGEAPPPIPQPVVPSPAATPTAADTQAPTAPSQLSTSKITNTGITLSWKDSTDNVGVVGYALYLNGTQIMPPSPSATSYGFSGLTCATSYTLGVQAYDASGNKSPIATKSTTTSKCPPPPAPPPSAGGSCPSNPLQGVQRPGQLTVLDGSNPCRTITGVKTSSHVEHDGDCHVNVKPDAPFTGLLNGVNNSAAGGNIITEVIPSHVIPIPTNGSHIQVFGTWVNDHATGWNELHAVWSYQILSGGTGSC